MLSWQVIQVNTLAQFDQNYCNRLLLLQNLSAKLNQNAMMLKYHLLLQAVSVVVCRFFRGTAGLSLHCRLGDFQTHSHFQQQTVPAYISKCSDDVTETRTSRTVVPTCLKASTSIPVLKMQRLPHVALTTTLMMCFKLRVMHHIKEPPDQDQQAETAGREDVPPPPHIVFIYTSSLCLTYSLIYTSLLFTNYYFITLYYPLKVFVEHRGLRSVLQFQSCVCPVHSNPDSVSGVSSTSSSSFRRTSRSSQAS